MKSHTNHLIPANAMFFIGQLALLSALSAFSLAQDTTAPETKDPIKISDTPKAIDPDTLMPASLTKKVTVNFEGVPLKKVIERISQESQLYVIVDYVALANVKILETDPIIEKLDDAPLYILLSRLEMAGLGWYMEGKSLLLTSRDEATKHHVKVSYNLSDFLDAGYTPAKLLQLVTYFTSNPAFGSNTGNGAVNATMIGDVLFVRQNEAVQREVAALLAALRQHGRRTFTFDTAQNENLRMSFNKVLTVDFQETPLIFAVQEISRQADISIRLDRVGLGTSSVRDRTPVTLKLKDQRLSLVLRTLMSSLGMGWYMQDNVLWLTSHNAADQMRKTAVFDVRDLCRNTAESEALKEAIMSQSQSIWRADSQLTGALEIPFPGVLVARHTEQSLDELLDLLESYRAALRVSKPRVYGPRIPPADEVVTGYYRMPAPMADDLKSILPRMIQPETWKSETAPQAVGEIVGISADGKARVQESSHVVAVSSENAVLVIKQTRGVHQKIGKFIESLNRSLAVDRDATSDTNQQPKLSVNFGSSLRPVVGK